MTDHKVNATIKGGVGYDAPWLTIGGDTPDEVSSALRWFTGTDSTDPAQLVVEAATKFQNLWAVKDALGGQVVPQQAQQAPVLAGNTFGASQQVTTNAPTGFAHQGAPQQQAAPTGPPAPSCQHGPMKYREGTGKASGKPYKAYFCPAPQGSAQCDPQFIR